MIERKWTKVGKYQVEDEREKRSFSTGSISRGNGRQES